MSVRGRSRLRSVFMQLAITNHWLSSSIANSWSPDFASAKDSHDAIHEAYVTGLTTSTELIELEASFADARGSYAIAKSGLLESMARLAYAAGQ